MTSQPRISIVTSSFNQGGFIGRTIESVLAQGYPNLEHIVVDGMSTDNTADVLKRYPHLRILREPDHGQADAINKGFRLATGRIYGFLNSDDILLPGTLQRVAEEIDPARDRHIVVGRCQYIDDDDTPTGFEHPSGYGGHLRVLQAWRPHTIPQPSTFWTDEVWRRCGPLDENEQLVLDYDLFCRFSREYAFHPIDRVLSAYRLHGSSKTCTHLPRHIYLACLRVSRRYWGAPPFRQYWQLLFDYLKTRWDRAADRCGEHGWKQFSKKRYLLAGLAIGAGACLNPLAAIRRMMCNRFYHSWADPDLSPESLRLRSFAGIHEDGRIGPEAMLPIELRDGQEWIELRIAPAIRFQKKLPKIEVRIDDQLLEAVVRESATEQSIFLQVANLPRGWVDLHVRANQFLVPHDYVGNGDYRPLSCRVMYLGEGTPPSVNGEPGRLPMIGSSNAMSEEIRTRSKKMITPRGRSNG